MSAPPWLRFHAYTVGLPKTGSTSLAGMLGGYRTRHEWQMSRLLRIGLAWHDDTIDAAGFWAATGSRLAPPPLEFDAATCHHLYADLLARQFPDARFIHAMRDVRTWVTSILDMGLRMRRARRLLGETTEDWQEAVLFFTGGTAPVDPDSAAPDLDAVVPLMHVWADHMASIDRLPQDRVLRIRTVDLVSSATAIATFLGIPADSVRADQGHRNPSPLTFDRFAAGDRTRIRDAYLEACAPHMARWLPDDHARTLDALAADSSPALSWDEHLSRTDVWAAARVAEHGQAAGR